MRKDFSHTEEKPKGFDLKVTYRDNVTGLITHTEPYILRVIAAADGGKTSVFERPKSSGNLWNKKNEPVGRWASGKWDKNAEHIAFERPLTQDQVLAKSLGDKDVQIAELQKELDAVKAEQMKKASVAPVKKDQGA